MVREEKERRKVSLHNKDHPQPSIVLDQESVVSENLFGSSIQNQSQSGN